MYTVNLSHPSRSNRITYFKITYFIIIIIIIITLLLLLLLLSLLLSFLLFLSEKDFFKSYL